MALSVSLSVSELTLDPGDFVRTEATIANSGPRPERVRLRVTGPAAGWSWVVPPDVEVPPGDEVVVSAGFRTPRAPETAAGSFAFSLVVSPVTGPPAGGLRAPVGTDAEVSGLLTVTPFQDLGVELDPPGTRAAGPAERVLVVENRGNEAVTATLTASAGAMDVALGSQALSAAPGARVEVPVRLRPGRRPALRARVLPFAVTAAAAGGEALTVSGELRQEPMVGRGRAGVALVLVVLLSAAVGLRLTVLAPGDSPELVRAGGAVHEGTAAGVGAGTGAGTGPGGCAVDGHRDTRVTGLTPERIPTLPRDYSFFNVASDDCSPVRWNPCDPIHFVINPANAPPTGVADAREAFARLATATGMTYVDDGLTDEDTPRGTNRAYQPDRYPGRWAPILVHWVTNDRGQGDVQIAGGGFPTRVGDVYVTGSLSLNPDLITNKETRTTVEGGFGNGRAIGAIGAEGVTWGRIILHELAHITGLGHTSSQSNLMYPEMSEQTGGAAFSRDDLAGLELLGRDAGCLESPVPGPLPDRRPGGSARPAP